MLIHDASNALNESAVAGATLATTNEDWMLGFASELGLVILIIIWLVSIATKPFRKIREVPDNPFAPYDGSIYLAVTDSRLVFFETQHNLFSTELGPVLAEHDRCDNVLLTRKGQTITLQFKSGLKYNLFWMDSQFAWQNVLSKLNRAGSVDAPPNAKR